MEFDLVFPDWVNVGFAVADPEAWGLRVWERGVGETRGCGAGASAGCGCGPRLFCFSGDGEVAGRPYASGFGWGPDSADRPRPQRFPRGLGGRADRKRCCALLATGWMSGAGCEMALFAFRGERGVSGG